MINRGLTGVLLIMLLTLAPAGKVLCQEIEEAASALHEVDTLLNQGDNQQAWQILLELPAAGQGDSGEKLWRMARAQYEMGRIEEPERPPLNFFRRAEGYARAAIAEEPEQAAGYKWLAITLGAQAKEVDTKTQIQLSREIKENIDKAIALDPDDDIAYLVLSRWHYKISGLGFLARTFVNIVYGGLPEASLEEAEELLWQAIGLHDRVAHRYNLAKVYDRMGRREAAVAQLQLALLLPATFPEEVEELDKAREKLQKWQ